MVILPNGLLTLFPQKEKRKRKYLMGSLLRVATDVDIIIINSEMGIRCMKKGNSNGLHQAFRNGYDISKGSRKKGHKVSYQSRLMGSLV